MSAHLLERRQLIERDRDEVFAFFADAHNLETITPPLLRFGVLAPPAIEMARGTLIAYRMLIHRVPVRWLTRIERWEPPEQFIDVQLRGPYSEWHHTHTFESVAGGTLIHDRVRYSIPLGALGELAHTAFVRADLERIFDHRRDAVASVLGTGAAITQAPLRD
ncbi:MAG TPA: SRPBCC family protein [Solirubrobacteraceae bacterium]|nr:SRPBCC family protein [Solirubrobacteraceae bacterium]